MALSAGQVLNGHYRVVSKLAEGGFGAVYRAWNLSIEASCAIKENLDSSPEAQKQFRREAVILANLQHPNLPRVTDHFVIPGQGQYLVMDFVEGEDLQDMLDRVGGPLPESQVISWIEQVCDALFYLHDQQPIIIHRDVKPANIKITADGKAILVDFGIAKAFDPNLKTTIGARAVTPGYSPPEQYGVGTTDAGSDVYALGATLYALLTGQQPPASTDRAAGVFFPPPRSLNPGVSPHIESTIQKAMALSQVDRFQSIAKFKRELIPPKNPPVRIALILGFVVAAVTLGVIISRGDAPPISPVTETPTWTKIVHLPDTPVTPTSSETVTTSPSPTITPSITPSQTLTNTPSITPTPTPILPPVMVEAYCDMFDESPIYVKQHQPVIIWWRWDAKTVAQVQDHLEAAQYKILLDGDEITAERQTGIEYLNDKGVFQMS